MLTQTKEVPFVGGIAGSWNLQGLESDDFFLFFFGINPDLSTY